MSHELLLEDLRRKGEEKSQAIWQEAEAGVEKFRAEISKAVEQKKADYQHDQAAACETLSKSLLTEAVNKARKIRTASEAELAERLYGLARQALADFRHEKYEELFAALVEELPAKEWQAVRVNPADQELARRIFPQAEVIADDRIVAGLEVSGDNGAIRIVNTLGKRLERAWPTVLPRMYAQLYEETETDDPAR